jgi:hypothetical protein
MYGWGFESCYWTSSPREWPKKTQGLFSHGKTPSRKRDFGWIDTLPGVWTRCAPCTSLPFPSCFWNPFLTLAHILHSILMGEKGMADPMYGKALSWMGDIGMNNIVLLILGLDAHHAPPCLAFSYRTCSRPWMGRIWCFSEATAIPSRVEVQGKWVATERTTQETQCISWDLESIKFQALRNGQKKTKKNIQSIPRNNGKTSSRTKDIRMKQHIHATQTRCTPVCLLALPSPSGPCLFFNYSHPSVLINSFWDYENSIVSRQKKRKRNWSRQDPSSNQGSRVDRPNGLIQTQCASCTFFPFSSWFVHSLLIHWSQYLSWH